jgi:malate dehydrogenase (oxaloacetate-decarboxylating)
MAAAGLSGDGLTRGIAVLDSRGLIVDDAGMDAYKKELAWPAALAHSLNLGQGRRNLLEVVNRYRPTVLIGASGQAGAFTADVMRCMARHIQRPVILPLSNPTSSCEAQPADIYSCTEGRALIATGSPFPDVSYAGRLLRVGQGNNAYVFPGVGLAILAAGLSQVDDDMFHAAARALAAAVTDAEIEAGLLYPPIGSLRSVSLRVARAVMTESAAGKDSARDVEQAINATIWEPVYPRYEFKAGR